MSPQDLRRLIRRFVSSRDPGEFRVGKALFPLLLAPDAELPDAVGRVTAELRAGLDAFRLACAD